MVVDGRLARRSGNISQPPPGPTPTNQNTPPGRCLAISALSAQPEPPFPSRRALWASRRRHHRHLARPAGKNEEGPQFESGAGRSC